MDATPRSITLKEVAVRAGVHASTVSLALREDARIPEKTRERIRAVAAALGYRPNPLIAALNVARQAGALHAFQASLGFVAYYHRQDRVNEDAFQHELFVGAKRRADELGYGIDYLWLREPGMTPERFERVLDSRHIFGLILAPLDESNEEYALDWNRRVAVAVGLSLSRPRLQRVMHDNFRGMLLALGEITRRGYHFVPRVRRCRRIWAWCR